MRVRQAGIWAVMGALALVGASAAADTLEPGEPTTLFDVKDVVTGLNKPTSIAFLPDGRMLITDKDGALLIAGKDGKTTTAGTFAVDTGSEKGLLHVILHPDFATNGLLILYYSASGANKDPGNDDDRHRVVTVPLLATDKIDQTKEKVLVRGLHGPANHDGGSLAIGPDGKLYIGVGDTGGNSGQAPEPLYTPTNFNGTCLTNPNGKILRVELDGKIPSDNPLVGKKVTACATAGTPTQLDPRKIDPTTLPEATKAREDIWAWGFRNPWRFWFDPSTKNLWVGDVGEITYEEVNVIPPAGMGLHYGWPYREADKGHPATDCKNIEPGTTNCVDPQYYCKHGAAAAGVDGNCTAVMGGPIVDSCQFPESFRGRYFFGDSDSHWVATLKPTADRNGIIAGSRQMFIRSAGSPVHFQIGPDGALYYAVIAAPGSGTIERVFPKKPAACTDTDAGAGGATGAGGGGSAGAANAGGAGGATASAGGKPAGGNSSRAEAGAGEADASARGAGGAGDPSSCDCRLSSSTARRAPPAPFAVAFGLGALLLRLRSRRTRRTGRLR